MLYTKYPQKQLLNLSLTKYALVGCFAASVAFTSCGSGDKSATGSNTTESAGTESKINETHFAVADLVDLDLTSYGYPVVTKAPKDAKVIKYDVNGSISVYGGKFFKLSFSQMDGALEDNINDMKMIVGDKEINPGFDKFEVEEKAGFLKKNTKGELAFTYGVDAAGKTILIQEGMPYDISPDQFTDYTADDVKIMFEAAKATVAKQ